MGEGEGEGEGEGGGGGEGEGVGEGEGEGGGEGDMITYTVRSWHQRGEEVAFDVTAKAHGDAVRAAITLAFDGERLIPLFPDVERWVPAPMLAFFTSHSEDPSSEVTDGLLDALIGEVDTDELEWESSCGYCAGSGEGMYDGTTCSDCRGSGVEQRGGRDDDE